MPPRKTPDRRQGKAGTTRDLQVIPGNRPAAPDMPAGLGKPTQARWDAFWSTDLSRAIVSSDHPVIERLFIYYDEWERAMRGYRKERVVVGSTGQPTMSPLFKVAQSLEAQIEALERQLGIGAKNRADLGIATGNAALTIAELNRMTEESDDDSDETILAEWQEAN